MKYYLVKFIKKDKPDEMKLFNRLKDAKSRVHFRWWLNQDVIEYSIYKIEEKLIKKEVKNV